MQERATTWRSEVTQVPSNSGKRRRLLDPPQAGQAVIGPSAEDEHHGAEGAVDPDDADLRGGTSDVPFQGDSKLARVALRIGNLNPVFH